VVMNRRLFMTLSATGLATRTWIAVPRALPVLPATKARIKAVAFDAFPIFDPRPVFALAEELFLGTGLSDEWRTRQFEYTWLRVAAHHYADFWQVTGEALLFATTKLKLRLRPDDRTRLMNAYLALTAWPDVRPALESLKASGLKLALLSNLTPTMLGSNIKSAGLEGMFERVVSTDEARTFKPDPRAYQLGVDALKVKREEILFVAFAGWDAAGAKLFGYPTYWVNRQRAPHEEMGALPDGSGETLSDLAAFLTQFPRNIPAAADIP
jgi:2-haloacid dehalogenase